MEQKSSQLGHQSTAQSVSVANATVSIERDHEDDPSEPKRVHDDDNVVKAGNAATSVNMDCDDTKQEDNVPQNNPPESQNAALQQHPSLQSGGTPMCDRKGHPHRALWCKLFVVLFVLCTMVLFFVAWIGPTYIWGAPSNEPTSTMPATSILGVSSNFIAMAWTFGSDWRNCSHDIYNYNYSILAQALGVCQDDHFCSYMDNSSCVHTGGTFRNNGSCAALGYARFLEFYAPVSGESTLQSCIRQSNGTSNDTYCSSSQAMAVSHHGSICTEQWEHAADNASIGQCASAGLSNHVLIPDSEGVDADVCMDLVESTPGCFCESQTGRRRSLIGEVCPDPITPPVYGACDTMCDAVNGFRSISLAAISMSIPRSGGIVSAIIGILWPVQSGESVEQLLSDIVDYVDAKVAAAVSKVLLSGIKTEWKAMAVEAGELKAFMATKNTSQQAVNERTNRLNSIISRCNTLVEKMEDSSIQPLHLLAYISPIGQACISFHFLQTYQYENVTGAKPPSGFVPVYTNKLNTTIHRFINISESTRSAALKWRVDDIKGKTWDGGWPCGWTCNHHYTSIDDPYCVEVGGPLKKRIAYVDNCCDTIHVPKDFVSFYKDVTSRAFDDSYIGVWVGASPLWKYQLPSSVEANSKPSLVINVCVSPLPPYRTATLEGDVSRFDRSEYDAILQITDRNANITKIQYTKGGNIIAIRIYHTIDGQKGTNTVGRWGMDEVKAELVFKRNEVISEIYDQLTEIKTVFVDSEGRFARNGRVWRPFPPEGHSHNISHLSESQAAPSITQLYDGYQPRMIGITGYWNHENAQAIVPMWLYETYEDTDIVTDSSESDESDIATIRNDAYFVFFCLFCVLSLLF